MLFDSQYNTKGLGFFGDLFGSCSSERADRDRTAKELESLPGQIHSLEKKLNELKNGSQQKLFEQLKKEIDKLALKKSALEVDKIQTIKLRDMWRDNPEVAVNGLGIRFTCNDYRNEANHNRERMLPLRQRKGDLEGQLRDKEKELSDGNIEIIRGSKKRLLTEIEVLQNEIKEYRNEIVTMQNARTARIEAEKLAAEQERQAREQRALEEEKKKKEAQQQNTLLLLGGAAAVAFLLLKSSNKTIVKVKG